MENNPYDFSKRSRRAILVFAVLLIAVVLIPRIILLFSKPSSFSYHQSQSEKVLAKETVLKAKKPHYTKRESRLKRPAHKFDPNNYSQQDWMKLGLSEKQAGVMISFGKYGYYSNEDLRKSFVMSDELFALVKDSIFYPSKPTKTPSTFEKPIEKATLVININTASEQDLMQLKGIGQFFAANIIKRRDQLGGFVSERQLMEVWKMDEEKIASIKPYIIIDPSQIRKFDLNTVTAEELKSHPYFSWNVANSIVKLRSQKGNYTSVEDIKQSVLIDDQLFDKIKVYLTVKK